MGKSSSRNIKGLPKDLLDILACPEDKAPVLEVTIKGKYALRCTKCKRIFEVRDNIPIMLPRDES
ncbi:MAG: hypothetical protein UX10_C0040G0012 [Candidatus Magasanikbacteria bacterium GW2011_GWA2_45_39]|uniref:Uncharacterized protein n=1 Tax=Candidatus Magasanikbacteria bacterium GW2011_GWA2_45_39 TaxID=1619041 RepID=A0A0G1PL32_9BACT|nr:MAG: hypothetical protein UX10_C0040G0012 [Candidatus Magasanikbacteria bacterium GW2011_GWA2_45_39]